MREIKFRAWDRKERQWATIDLCYWSESTGPGAVIADSDPQTFELRSDERFIWLQYTGLKDKNGREIYEGDIVRFPKYSRTFVGAVEYSHFYAGFKPFVELGQYQYEGCEVIGNIYENPKLLGKESNV